MNEIQKSNAKIAIEYYQKLLEGRANMICFIGKGGLEYGTLSPDFLRDDVRYFFKEEMVEHKGGKYPKPVEAREVVNGKQYYVADPVDIKFYEYMTGDMSCEVFIRQVKRGLLHETKEAAIQHAKVMLGVSDEA